MQKKLAHSLKMLLYKKGFKQIWLAQALEVTPAYIHYLLSGQKNISDHKLQNILEIIGASKEEKNFVQEVKYREFVEIHFGIDDEMQDTLISN